MNTLRTITLMGVLAAMVVALGGILGGKTGMYMAFFFALVSNLGAYWFSDKIALAMNGAQPVARDEAPELYEIVEGLCARAGIPVPRIYITPSQSPNAFATGRDPEHSAVAVTTGILRILNRSELEGVLAHELGHVRNRDVLICTIGAVMASVLTWLAHWGMYLGGGRDEEGGGPNPLFLLVLVILAPIAAMLINMAISRTREYEADATGAKLCGQPLALASALAKLEQGVEAQPMYDANPAMSSLYIVKPERGSWIINLLSTHPPIPERIKRLTEMAYLAGETSTLP